MTGTTQFTRFRARKTIYSPNVSKCSQTPPPALACVDLETNTRALPFELQTPNQVAAPVVGATEELLTAEALRGMLTSLKVPAPLILHTSVSS